MKKADYILWACVVVLGTMQGIELGRSLRMQERLADHSEQLERAADRNHADKDLRQAWGTLWEDRFERIEKRLTDRRIGDAPPAIGKAP